MKHSLSKMPPQKPPRQLSRLTPGSGWHWQELRWRTGWENCGVFSIIWCRDIYSVIPDFGRNWNFRSFSSRMKMPCTGFRKWSPPLSSAGWKKMYWRICRRSWKKICMQRWPENSRNSIRLTSSGFRCFCPNNLRKSLTAPGSRFCPNWPDYGSSAVTRRFYMKNIRQALQNLICVWSWSTMLWNPVIKCWYFPSLPLCWTVLPKDCKRNTFLISCWPEPPQSRSGSVW